jgi:hypothetical protein
METVGVLAALELSEVGVFPTVMVTKLTKDMATSATLMWAIHQWGKTLKWTTELGQLGSQ